jgi:inner membrane transporter RhtA
VIPYVGHQLAMGRLPRATYALLTSLLPATATVIGVVVLTLPTAPEIAGVVLVILGVALHREGSSNRADDPVQSEERVTTTIRGPPTGVDLC